MAELKHKWDFRTGSPHRVFRAIQDVVEDMGYSIQVSEPLELKSSPITDTAILGAEVKGEKELVKRHRWENVVAGVVCILMALALVDAFILAIVLGVLGLVFLVTVSHVVKAEIAVRMEGEGYKAAVKVAEQAQAAEVIADIRVVAVASVIGKKGEKKKVSGADKSVLEKDFVKLRERIETVLPSFEVKSV